MVAGPLRIEPIDRLTEDIFVVGFSDSTVVVLTDEEILDHYGSGRMPVKSIDPHVAPS
jgi:hypothetical protein